MTHYHNYSAVYVDDGLDVKSKKRYQRRRDKLAERAPYLIVLKGLSKSPERANEWGLELGLYQDPFFLYLTGINQLGMALVINPYTNEEILFCPKKDKALEFWEGLRFGVGAIQAEKELTQVTGFKTLKPISELSSYIKAQLNAPIFKQKKATLATIWQVSKKGKVVKDSNDAFSKTLKRALTQAKLPATTLKNIQEDIWKDRSCLDSVDINNLKDANKKTAESFISLCKALKTIPSENAAEGHLRAEMLSKSSQKPSFPPIVACGDNATILHYTKNNSPLKKGRLLLLDFGLRRHTVPADISRTIPINGKFNPLQALCYDIVLSAQNKVESIAKAGVTLEVLNKCCWDHINAQLKTQLTDKGGTVNLGYTYKPHNVGHLIGLLVHDGDPFRDYREMPLQPGWVISNEPGLYGEFSLTLNGKTYKERIGIRIEDNLRITKTGCENLSTSCPKERAEIEALIGQP